MRLVNFDIFVQNSGIHAINLNFVVTCLGDDPLIVRLLLSCRGMYS